MTSNASNQKKRKRPEDGETLTFKKSGKDGNKQQLNPDKRRKFQDAREIQAQSTDAAFRNGQLDVSSFINSRKYEIDSLLRSMSNSKNASKKRAFQSLPREMRRRTAAHNPSRVPKRVRNTAKKEFTEDNTVIPKKRRDYTPKARRLNALQLKRLSIQQKSNLRKSETRNDNKTSKSIEPARPLIKPSRYRKRQKDKTWLPTHIWSAKRARMVRKWGFSLVETPTLKCYRPTYRAATRQGCVAFDTSYEATLLLEGQENDLKRCLSKFLQPRDTSIIGKSVIAGERAVSTWIYEHAKWPEGALSPVLIFWCALITSSKELSKPKGERQRQVVIKVHPSALGDVLAVVASSSEASKCTVKNLRYEVGSLLFVGPKSQEILNTLLFTLSLTEKNFLAADGAADSTSPSLDGIHNLNVLDPRLNEFLRKNKSSQNHSPQIREGGLFDVRIRNKSIRTQISQKTINAKVSKFSDEADVKNLITSIIPAVLIKSGLGQNSSPSFENVANESKTFETWSLLLPWKWIRPFWLVLVRIMSVRFGGLKELEQLTLEFGVGCYPLDFVATSSGKAEAVQCYEQREDLRKRRMGIKTRVRAYTIDPNETYSEKIYGYPWNLVVPISLTEAADNQKLWHITPSVFHLLSKTPCLSRPIGMHRAIFTARIELHRKGSIEPNARVYQLPKAGTVEYEEIRLQYVRDNRLDLFPFERDVIKCSRRTKSKNNDKKQEKESTQYDDASENENKDTKELIGFIIRGAFGYMEGTPVGIAAISWSKIFEDSQVKEGICNGWCIIQNKKNGVLRLARWSAI